MLKKTLAMMLLVPLLLIGGNADAKLKVIGSGKTMGVDISNFPQAMKEAYPLFRIKCIKCHGLDRTFQTLQSGIAPSGSLFDNKSIDGYGLKMLRKPDSSMNKKEIKIVMDLLRYMLAEADKN